MMSSKGSLKEELDFSIVIFSIAFKGGLLISLGQLQSITNLEHTGV